MPSPLATPGPWDLVATAYAEHLAPHLALYAADALTWARVSAGHRVVDVAAGPGTLSLQAAARGAQVEAVDHAPRMVALLRERAGAGTVHAHVGDGTALPFADRTFDAGFSMFGLMFFADRARGFAELYRVLEPGGVAVVSSWPPIDRVPFYARAFGAVREVVPELPPPPAELPLGTPAVATAEMAAAGFVAVEVREVTHVAHAPSSAAAWSAMQVSSAPFAMMQAGFGPARWPAIAAHVEAALVRDFGAGPQAMPQTAYLTRAVRPG